MREPVPKVSIELGPRAERFRAEVRRWLAEHRPSLTIAEMSLDRIMFNDYSALEAWAKEVYAGGYMCIGWPEEYGGQGASEREVVVLNEEFARAGVPRPTRGLGETLVGQAVLKWGSSEQKARLLPRIVDGTDRYCQGFSEPGAGSDLKALTTRGVVEDDCVVVSGQKVWTSGATDANILFCLCRTGDPDVGHAGITYVIIPMYRTDGSANGIEVRPIRQPTGSHEFAEVFLSEARAPLENVIGGVNKGWRVAMTTLGSERAGAVTLYWPFAQQFWRLVDEARTTGAASSPAYRQELARAFTDVELMRYSGLRMLAAALTGHDAGAAPDLTKLHWSEHAVRVASLSTYVRGAAALLHGADAPDETDEWTRGFLFAPGYTIAGGTSEVLRDVIAERALGLPRHRG